MRMDSHLPERFDFYHLGTVERARQLHTVIEDFNELILVGFRIVGSHPGWLIIGFDRDLDLSTYSELGNILASQWVNHLSQHLDEQDLILSPPKNIEANDFVTWSNRALRTSNLNHLTYFHTYNGIQIPVHVWTSLGQNQEEIAHA